MKIIAFYLPQFHTIPENDTWWGKGFTEWVNVKKAKPLFKGHDQPRIPLNNNYYDLNNPETLKWQANLAHQYGVDGFCFYHYWFKGKLLLEKPAESLLKRENIALDYCFCWANEPWARTWDGRNRNVLMPQEYGGREEWKKHFDYLLPFFKDVRYIKENNKPMFVIYKSTLIEECRDMMDYWSELAVNNGFEGLFFVETLKKRFPDQRELPFSAKVEFEPYGALNMRALAREKTRRFFVRIINRILKMSILENKAVTFQSETKKSDYNRWPEGTFAGAFVGWDNTPRRGVSGTVVKPPSKEEFKAYLNKKIELSKNVYKTGYVFINAWNEWAEGTYLEPDTLHGYNYLEAISECKDNKTPS